MRLQFSQVSIYKYLGCWLSGQAYRGHNLSPTAHTQNLSVSVDRIIIRIKWMASKFSLNAHEITVKLLYSCNKVAINFALNSD